jgi:hypothetical protein
LITINDPEVVVELKALYPRYEEALLSNDVDTLMDMFWAGPEVMRFGVTENLYGPQELAAFRKGRSATNLVRTVTKLDLVSFGRDFASVTLEFERAAASAHRLCPRLSVAGPLTASILGQGRRLFGKNHGQHLLRRCEKCRLQL